jgi:hypothetical protein
MAKSTPAHITRTKGEAILDLDFVIELCVLSQRFYERLRKGLLFMSLIMGTAAFASLVHWNPIVLMVTAFLTMTFALLQHVYDFREKASKHEALYKRSCKLKARSGDLTLVQLDRAMSNLAGDTIPVIQALRRIAHNNNLRRHGFNDYTKPLSLWQRLLCVVVGSPDSSS